MPKQTPTTAEEARQYAVDWQQWAWVFPTKHFNKIDYYLLFCLKGTKIIKILLVPTVKINKVSGIGVGKNSKYDVYKIYGQRTTQRLD